MKAQASSNSATPQPQTFLCFCMHALPSSSLLASHTQVHQAASYAFRFLGAKGQRKAQALEAGATCIVRLLRKQVEIMPLPASIDASNAPYALAYDFFFKKELDASTKSYSKVASYYGFAIATLPSHDFRRATGARVADQPAQALLYIDRAILALAEHNPITPEVEKAYSKMLKLRNLYLDQPEVPEGLLAFERSFSFATRCYTLLLKGN